MKRRPLYTLLFVLLFACPLTSLAQQETAKALAAISPAAAARIGGPLPAPLPALPDIGAFSAR